ncbi:hypothetical protein [Glutamicibacter ardleyensis]|uniref:Uncharacterized protein n=1 Tax=Glutamicibacter ardleyensis TaxID=225894 RepID=A0ABQ2DV76_9MICC|nr:hypothetical protein [Glutamicibacter ardleyensis]GGJ74548.1 hypothetical protein GCM10007173_36910 [Glutamicibacter ardleyensis]
MSAETILRMASRRMWRFWAPLISFLLVFCGLTAQLSNGISGLAALVALMLVTTACGDWFTAERAAYNAEHISL